MRRSGRRLSAALAAFGLAALASATAFAQTPNLPDRALRVAVSAALTIVEGDAVVWPAARLAPRQILLVVGESEFLFCPEPAVAADLSAHGLSSLGRDGLSGCDVAARPRTLAPDLLATLPLFGDVPTVVMGTPAATGWSYPDWTATLLHERVHQMQNAHPAYSEAAAALDLARGDRTGRWMLEYDFPYAEAAPRFRILADRAVAALAAEDAGFRAGLDAYLRERVRLLAALEADDARYVELQLWQEGVARWSEGALARAAGLRWPLDETWLAGYEARNARELAGADLARDGRPAFYALGAAEAAMLERLGAGWRTRYLAEPFALGPFFEVGNSAEGALPTGESAR